MGVYDAVDDTLIYSLRRGDPVQHLSQVLSVRRHADLGASAQQGRLKLAQGSTTQHEATGLVVRLHDPTEKALGWPAQEIGIDENYHFLGASAPARVRHVL